MSDIRVGINEDDKTVILVIGSTTDEQWTTVSVPAAEVEKLATSMLEAADELLDK